MKRDCPAALWIFLLLLAGMTLPQPAFARTGPASDAPQQLEERLGRIEERLSRLERKLDALEGTTERTATAALAASPMENRLEAAGRRVRDAEAVKAAAAQSPGPAPSATMADARRNGFVLRSGPDFRLRVGGFLQADSRWFPGSAAPGTTSSTGPDTFLLRRARMVLEGVVYRYFDFRFIPDFGNNQVSLQEMRVDLTSLPVVRLRAGKFKVPVSLERLQSATDLLFTERGFPSSLAPNRSIGAMAYRDLLGGAVQLAAGVFNGSSDNTSGPDLDTNDGKDLAGRIFLLPLRNGAADIMKGFGFGIAGSTGRQLGALPVYRSAGQAIFFQYAPGVSADGRSYRISPQGYYYAGSWGLLGEYVGGSQEIRKGTAVRGVRNHAWQIAGSRVFGGKASYGGVIPTREFDRRTGGLGALELAARYGELAIDPAAFAGGFADAAVSARTARAWAVGLNWHLARQVKFVVDYEQTRYAGGGVAGDRDREHAVLTRFQVGF